MINVKKCIPHRKKVRNMKKLYEAAELEIIEFTAQDLIRTSTCTTDCGEDCGDDLG